LVGEATVAAMLVGVYRVMAPTTGAADIMVRGSSASNGLATSPGLVVSSVSELVAKSVRALPLLGRSVHAARIESLITVQSLRRHEFPKEACLAATNLGSYRGCGAVIRPPRRHDRQYWLQAVPVRVEVERVGQSGGLLWGGDLPILLP